MKITRHHPEVLGNGLGLVSPDLVGPLCDKLEADEIGNSRTRTPVA